MWYNKRGLYEINKVNLETIAMMTFGIALYPEKNIAEEDSAIPKMRLFNESNFRTNLSKLSCQNNSCNPNWAFKMMSSWLRSTLTHPLRVAWKHINLDYKI
jgi:hypothetical protein